jgi:hypothetical protein
MSNIPSPVRPLNIGNVVSAGLVLYRSNLKQYADISLRANLWSLPAVLAFITLYFSLLSLAFRSIDSSRFANRPLAASFGPIFEFVERLSSAAPILIPISLLVCLYCFAKYLANSALISRLAYQELANQPESIGEASPKVLPRMWAYLRVALEILLRLFGLYILLSIVGGVVISFLSIGARSTPGALNQSPLLFVVVIAVLFAMIWCYSRWIVAELPLAVESGLGSSHSVKRSWELTASAVGRVQAIVFVAFLVTIPIQVITNYLPRYLLGITRLNISAPWLALVISLGIGLIGGILVLPFWQSIKAVMYYDLRSRREGIDLQLRDR